ncbi:MAG TPA: exo-beta-N-acetylmuramidase NamZ domain-containing protein [Bryobacteraceae bacterium]|nr:exo-beta-N-acetylmuramidase NamZ domain-containing protein [Bryobacteraceae bacterium]
MRFLLLFFSVGLLVSQESFTGGPYLDAVVEQSIKDSEIPGAVIAVGHRGRVVYQKVYGARALVPQHEPMTLDTIFDAASLTKVVATTTSIMKLVERGKIRLSDSVSKYLPEYQGGKSEITVRHLLTHFSGLRPDLDLKPEWSGYETGIQKALEEKPVSPPGTRFVYSDVNFELLGEIVRQVAGKPLDEFARDEIFTPLGMADTGFRPAASLLPRIAPTEVLAGDARPLRGIVHDPTARFMGGVAGHAGMFTTVADLIKFAEMLLNLGERNGVRVLSPLSTRKMTSPQSPEEQPVLRGLGWDIDSPFSGPRGDLYPIGSYGHTGFTGTSLWIDPATQSYVILLANAVHPHTKLAITPLRARVATIVAAGLNVDVPAGTSMAERPRAPQRSGVQLETRTGLDVLAAEGFASLKGRRVGVITNHTGISRDGKRNIDLMVASGVNLRALFSPEHGMLGTEDHDKIGNTIDPATRIRVYSLYSGQDRRPNDEMLKDIEMLVFDIQDIGTRFYTYTCTMRYAMEEAAKRGIAFVVLDRPNPITGEHVEGPMLDPSLKSFVGCGDIALRHGMTIGELARMFNDELQPRANLRVVSMQNWRRSAWWDETGLRWVNPSPNMRSLNAALLYPGIGMLEYAKVYSVGRGTDSPFEQIGADWIRGPELAVYINQRRVAGIRVYPTSFTPSASNFPGKTIEGVRFVITDRDRFDSARFGLELGAALARLFPGKMAFLGNERLAGSRELLKSLEAGAEAASLLAQARSGVEEFSNRRARYLLY